MRCNECRHWAKHMGQLARADGEYETQKRFNFGECRRNAPFAGINSREMKMSNIRRNSNYFLSGVLWPITFEDEWCGQFAAK